MIRGISDMPTLAATEAEDSGQTNQRDSWAKYASAVAAGFTVYWIMQAWPLGPKKRPSTPRTPVGNTTPPPSDKHDAEVAKAQMIVFNRTVFRVPCTSERGLGGFQEAMNQIITSLNSGKLESDSEQLIGTAIPPSTAYQIEANRKHIATVLVRLNDVQIAIDRVDEFFSRMLPDAKCRIVSIMVEQVARKHSLRRVREAFKLMDEVDKLRNDVLDAFNAILQASGGLPFPLIELSSRQPLALSLMSRT